ncbi:MAG: 50S ribosomal protein L18 [Gammaproteobacteria bacterium]|nr:50S ribosomal protein L18 [Gammaproteobacteria bacterium]
MHAKKAERLRRAAKTRVRIQGSGSYRLCVYRTPRHIYAQVITPAGSETLVSASTLDAQVKSEVKNGGNVDAARVVGRFIAERARAKGISAVAFDRSGFKYHGRVKALADAAREHGLEF